MSWFSKSTVPAGQPNFVPVSSSKTGYGALTDKDTAWSCVTNKGFRTETQTWYSVLADGTMMMCQVIWSYVGVWPIPAQTQFTFKLYNPKTKKTTWRSLNASGWTVDQADGRNCKANEFEIKHTGTADSSETYNIHAQLDATTTLSVVFTRPEGAKGFKLGQGEDGGYSTFGHKGEDGFVIHRFHPFVQSSGQLMVDGTVVDAKGEAMFVHAIQGMRPDSVASRWNFAFFTTTQADEDEQLGSVRAIQMEFETTDSYGPKGPKTGRVKCNLGCIYSSKLGQPLLVTSQTGPESVAAEYATIYPKPAQTGEICRATHTKTGKDSLTGYDAPLAMKFEWEGKEQDKSTPIKADVEVQTSLNEGEGGLIQKVDVFHEFPALIRKALSSLTGAQPYIFQYHNDCTLNVTIADKTSNVRGWMFNEASFISP